MGTRYITCVLILLTGIPFLFSCATPKSEDVNIPLGMNLIDVYGSLINVNQDISVTHTHRGGTYASEIIFPCGTIKIDYKILNIPGANDVEIAVDRIECVYNSPESVLTSIDAILLQNILLAKDGSIVLVGLSDP